MEECSFTVGHFGHLKKYCFQQIRLKKKKQFRNNSCKTFIHAMETLQLNYYKSMTKCSSWYNLIF